MREHPVLFSAPMIRALLAGRKFVTRRLSPQWDKVKAGDRLWVRETWASPETDKTKPGRIAYNADGVCGAWLWDGDGGVTFLPHGRILQAEGYHECFPTGGASTFSLGKYSDIRSGKYPSYRYGWRPCIHMPRWASRILLEVEEDTRVERLQDITAQEVLAEGVTFPGRDGMLSIAPIAQASDEAHLLCSFRSLWDSLHTKPGERWEDNPVVRRVGRFHVVGADRGGVQQ